MCSLTLELYVQEWKHMPEGREHEFDIKGIRNVKYFI